MHGDAWRWYPEAHPYAASRSVYVIEPAVKREAPKGRVHRVAFGFSVREPQPEIEPLRWEGDDS